MSGDGFPRLLADVGGTSIRLALQAGPGAPLAAVETSRADAHPSLEAALADYLSRHGTPRARSAAIGVATAVTGDLVQMTNRSWSFSIGALQSALELRRLVVLNDFTALALALPALSALDLRQVGGGQPLPGQPLALIGPGTGLGVSGLLPAGERWLPLAGEGGHASLAAANEQEAAVIALLRRRFGHVSAERLLSGPGLVNLYAALAELDAVAPRPLDAAGVVEEALAGADARCVATVDIFLAWLGSVGGDLALTLGARGGVYIGGGIVPRLGRWIERSRFRERFEAKGRFRDYLAAIPTFVIDAAVPPALTGAARALDQA